MKVYSSNRNHRKSFIINQTLRNNIETLSQLLHTHQSPSLSLSPSIQSFDGEGDALALAREFVTALNDPYQAMLLYPLIIDSPFAYTPDPIFQQTTYPPELHPLLSLYLHKVSGYMQLQRQGRRIIDVFYHYLSVQAPWVFQQWLNRNENQSLGEWFYTQCIAGFFQLIFRNKQEYTIFLSNFLQEGIAYALVAASHALRKAGPPAINGQIIDRVRLSFVSKYKLDSQ